jgi:hypothetical protein
MKVAKGMVVDRLRAMGKDAEAQRAERDLGDEVDTDDLEPYGIDAGDLQHEDADDPTGGDGAAYPGALPPGGLSGGTGGTTSGI